MFTKNHSKNGTNLLLFSLCLLLFLSFSACKKTEIEYTLSLTSLSFDAAGGEKEFTVTVKSPAIVKSVETLEPWCQVSKSGESPVTVVVKLEPNDIYTPRETSVTVNLKLDETELSVTVEIRQGSAEWVSIGGVKWAICNVDAPGTFAAHPKNAGMFYQWNRKVGWSTTNPMVSSDDGTTWNSSNPIGNTWEKANDPCPSGWRVPTRTEVESLANSGSFWDKLDGISGRFFGTGDLKAFFPAAGCRDYNNGTLYYMGDGNYWSDAPNGSETAYGLNFSSDYAGTSYGGYRSNGFSVRCVKE